MLSCDDTMQENAIPSIPFMHKTHVEKYGIKDCGTCHKYDEIERFQGLPTIGECTACHDRNGELTGKDHMTPRKKTVFDSFADKDKPWAFRAKKPGLLYYSHKIVMSSKSEDVRLKSRCETCHGDKAGSTVIARVTGNLLMEQCMDCHDDFKIVNKCPVCH